MQITECNVSLAAPSPRHESSSDRLLAGASIVLDGVLVVHELKVVHGNSGLILAFPDRRIADRCPNCGAKNPLRQTYCGACGIRLGRDRAVRDADGREKLYASVANPIDRRFREYVDGVVLGAYEAQVGRQATGTRAARLRSLDELTAQAQELGMGY